MIFDPDEPRSQARTDRQSLIRTSRGWAVMGQPTEAAEAWVRGARDELAEMLTSEDPDRAISRMASALVDEGVL